MLFLTGADHGYCEKEKRTRQNNLQSATVSLQVVIGLCKRKETAALISQNRRYVWLWILCGLPFGLHRMCLWIVPGGGSLGGGIALFALNFIIGGVIGGFVLAWRLIVAVWYVPLTVYRLIVG